MRNTVQIESERIPGGKFAIFLGCACLLLAGGAITTARFDDTPEQRGKLESTELALVPDPDEEQFFPAPHEMKVGLEIARMDRRPLYLMAVGAISQPEEDVMVIGLEDQRIYPIYQLKVPPEEGPNYYLLKTAPDTYLKITDRLNRE